MIKASDNRNGSDRRDGNVSHLTIMNKLVEHDDLILKQQEADRMMARDIKDIKSDLHPITKGVNSIVWLGRFIVAVGAVAAALIAVDTFWNQAHAATAIVREGEFVAQYNLSDPGNASGFDNNRVFVSHQIAEVVIRVSGANAHTSSESWLCWSDPDETLCPDDDIGGGIMRMPVLKFLADIQIAGEVTRGANLTDLQEKAIYLAFWHEYRTKRLVTTSIAEMVTEGLNATQQRRGLKFIYFSNGVDLATAQALANDRINNGTIATYEDYGLATMPLQDRRLLKLFSEVGWFE